METVNSIAAVSKDVKKIMYAMNVMKDLMNVPIAEVNLELDMIAIIII